MYAARYGIASKLPRARPSALRLCVALLAALARTERNRRAERLVHHGRGRRSTRITGTTDLVSSPRSSFLSSTAGVFSLVCVNLSLVVLLAWHDCDGNRQLEGDDKYWRIRLFLRDPIAVDGRTTPAAVLTAPAPTFERVAPFTVVVHTSTSQLSSKWRKFLWPCKRRQRPPSTQSLLQRLNTWLQFLCPKNLTQLLPSTLRQHVIECMALAPLLEYVIQEQIVESVKVVAQLADDVFRNTSMRGSTMRSSSGEQDTTDFLAEVCGERHRRMALTRHTASGVPSSQRLGRRIVPKSICDRYDPVRKEVLRTVVFRETKVEHGEGLVSGHETCYLLRHGRSRNHGNVSWPTEPTFQLGHKIRWVSGSLCTWRRRRGKVCELIVTNRLSEGCASQPQGQRRQTFFGWRWASHSWRSSWRSHWRQRHNERFFSQASVLEQSRMCRVGHSP